MTQPREIVQRFYDLFMAGKMEEMLTTSLTSDCVLENPLPEPIAFGGRFEGPQGIAAYLEKIAETVQIQSFEIRELLEEGDRVIAIGHEKSRVLSTGKSYTMEWVHALRVRDGRVCELREYNDTAAMRAAFLK